MNSNVTLKHLGNRLIKNKELLKKHQDDPYNKELLERKIAETQQQILDCVYNNTKSNNANLNHIYL